ncbi:MAG: hypothetical protein FWC53_01740, partial [Firmicutes bacterium]|nr:hypothetical protein [Bacillota bacterium]
MDLEKNSGITLITLVITIILMMILSYVGITVGMTAYQNSKTYRFVTQMQLIQGMVDEVAGDKSIDVSTWGSGDGTAYAGIIDSVRANEDGISIKSPVNYAEFRYFNLDDMSNTLGLDNLTGKGFLINFTTREVISITGTKINGTTYYTQYSPDIPNGQTLVTYAAATQDLSFNCNLTKNSGLTAVVTISNVSIPNGTLRYREAGTGTWQVITNKTDISPQTYDVSIIKTGKYEFKLTDPDGNDSPISTVNIALVNMPELSNDLTAVHPSNNTPVDTNTLWYNYESVLFSGSTLDSSSWAYALSSSTGETYVWLPKFAYNSSSSIKFLKGTSNIPTDNSNIQITSDGANDTYIVPEIFDGVTGIWTLNTDNNDILDIINKMPKPDTVAPTILISAPSSALVKNGASVTYTVTYYDDNFSSSTLSVANITLNKTGTANGTVAVSGTGNTRTVTISNVTGDGTLGISIAAGTATDTLGNAAPAAGPSATFTVDSTAPTITISAPSATMVKGGASVTYTVTYADTNFSSSTLAVANITLNKTG